MTEYMLLEGYGSSLSYKEDIPGWWPESIDHKKWFEKFKHPGGANIKHLALFLRAILQHYGHDAETYHQEGIIEKIEPKRKKPQKKWKSKKSKQVMPDDTIEEDIAEEEANRDRAARAMEAARAELRDMEENRNMSEERHEVVEDTDRVESRSEEEVANRARAAKAMEAVRAGGRDTAEASDMEDVLDTAEDHDTAEVTDRVEDRDTMSGSEVEVVMAATTPSRRKLTGRRYSVQPPSPQPHAGCGLDITMPLFYDAFKAPSQREVNKWLAAYKSTSVLALSPQASYNSPSILTLSPQDSS